MSSAHNGKKPAIFNAIDVERRYYGRRYTGLPVDTIDRTSFAIDCTDGYMRPTMYDLQVGDRVRWLKNGRYVQAEIARIEHTDTHVYATLTEVILLPPDFFPQ